MLQRIVANYYKIIIPVLVLLLGVFFQDKLQELYNTKLKNVKKSTNGVLTADTLQMYNGITKKKLYVAVLGVVFDVTKSNNHYGKDAAYHYFVGKDGSRSLVTGDFKDESPNKDHVLDLPCADILTLLHWKESFQKKYKKIGVLQGRYYESNGKMTEYLLEFGKRIEECQKEKEAGKLMDEKYPPCNIAWSEDEGTKVWCTKTSGGISRYWVGVPRQMFIPGESSPKCVCINTDKEQEFPEGLIKEYSNCANTSAICYVKN